MEKESLGGYYEAGCERRNKWSLSRRENIERRVRGGIRQSCTNGGDFSEIDEYCGCKEEDNNIRFFHRMTISHRRTNFIGELKVDGTLLTEEDIRGAIVSFYDALYNEDAEWRPRMDGLYFFLY